MKKFTLGIIFLLITGSMFGQDLFFSEYGEGSGYNKYLEIFNPTNETIDLSTYAYPNVSNDPTVSGRFEYWNTFAEGATIAPGGVYIISDSRADQIILDLADMNSDYLSNGDDGFALAKIVGTGSEADTVYLDWIGTFSGQKDTYWAAAGVSDATKDHTLLRKEITTTGNTWELSAGTNEEDSEWIVKDADYFYHLGKHRLVIPDLFISEYCEGSSYNKYLEFYNPTSESIDLSTYAFPNVSNDPTTPGEFEYWNTFEEGATVAAGGTYVVSDSRAVQSILDMADMNHDYLSNGDDGFALAKIVGTGTDADTVYLDWVGTFSGQKDTYWEAAGVADATKDHTLLRKPGMFGGNTWAMSAGTNEEDSEWIVKDVDYFDDIDFYGIAEKDVLEFAFKGFENKPSVIDLEAKTITSEVADVADLTALVATFEVSAGAMVKVGDVEQESGVTANDFTSPVVYTVISAGGPADEFTVTVAQVTNPNNDIEVFVLLAPVGDAVIDKTEHTVTAVSQLGTDMTSLSPYFEVSPGATILPTEPQNFSAGAITYTVTSETDVPQEWVVTVTEEELPLYTIYEIQFTDDASGDSPKKGEKVVTSGVVTGAVEGKFYIQDGAGAWNGVYVYDVAKISTAVVGDRVTLVAEVQEYYTLTEMGNVESVTIEESDVTLPEATAVTTSEANSEMYEGVLVTVTGAECTQADLDADHGMFSLDDGSGIIKVDDELFSYEAPTLGTDYDVTGPLTFSFDEFKIVPRSADDIVVTTTGIEENLSTKFDVYPNPSNGQLNIEGIEGEFTLQVYNAIGALVYDSNRTFVNNANVNLESLNNGIYFVRVQEDNKSQAIKLIINK